MKPTLKNVLSGKARPLATCAECNKTYENYDVMILAGCPRNCKNNPKNSKNFEGKQQKVKSV